MTAPQPRDYQFAAIDAIERELRLHRSTLLVLATGLGKTVTFSDVARRVVQSGGRVLVLAHRSELLDQALLTLRSYGLPAAIECGDQRVDHADLPAVVVASIQSLQRARLTRIPADTFALIVVDEAQHATAKSYQNVLDHFASAKVLGVTATPGRLDGVGLGNVFASVAYRMDLHAGIKAGWLCPLELRTVRVEPLDLSHVRSVAGELHAGDLEAELTKDAVLRGVAVPLAELIGTRQTLLFGAGVAQCHALAAQLLTLGVRAAAVDGSMSAEQRARILADYRAGRLQVVANAMLWTEGFDSPSTSCIALVRPTRSGGLVTQMIGRGTRLAEGKVSCLVLDFVPSRWSTCTLASPADALAGEALPDDAQAMVRELTGEGQLDLFAAIAQARADLAATQAAEHARRAERLRGVDVRYSITHLNMADLLEVVEPDPKGGPTASTQQIYALRTAGLKVPDDISRVAATKLFAVLDQRRRLGLCSIKQARKLRAAGLRDDVTFELARIALDAISANGWRGATPELRADKRFAPGEVFPLSRETRTAIRNIVARVRGTAAQEHT